jgi:hypothetical protein
LARALLLAHLGLLLLWQPFLRAEQRVSLGQGLILSIVALVLLLRLDWWLLAFWVIVLAGLVGGKVYQHHARWQRRCYLVVLAYLLALLAIAILPEIAPRREIAPEIRTAAEYVLPFAFVLIALFPAEAETVEAAQVIDFFYSVFLMLVLVVVVLGSFTFMTLTRSGYLQSLTATIFLTARRHVADRPRLSPRSGGGLGVFFTRYLSPSACRSSAGCTCSPSCLQSESRPERFLDEAVAGARAAARRSPGSPGARARKRGERGERHAQTRSSSSTRRSR